VEDRVGEWGGGRRIEEDKEDGGWGGCRKMEGGQGGRWRMEEKYSGGIMEGEEGG
jgi:hypothetical protein